MSRERRSEAISAWMIRLIGAAVLFAATVVLIGIMIYAGKCGQLVL